MPTNPSHHFTSVNFTGLGAGPRLIVTAAVHGNERCGSIAIQRLIDAIERGAVPILNGSLTLVPVANPLAYARGQRFGERNLNRSLFPTDAPRQFEDHVANWLCPLLARHDVLLDLHSFSAPGRPFCLVGPADNAGPLEPFAHAEKESALALRLGVDRFVHGWLATHATGVRRRMPRASDAELETEVRYGVGTTEYMRRVGGYALTLECGQHDDPAAPEVAYRAILNTLAHLGMSGGPAPAPAARIEGLALVDVIDKADRADAFARAWTSFDPLRAGELIGTRADGTSVLAARDGMIVFPDAQADAGHEWFYLAGPSPRF